MKIEESREPDSMPTRDNSTSGVLQLARAKQARADETGDSGHGETGESARCVDGPDQGLGERQVGEPGCRCSGRSPAARSILPDLVEATTVS